VSASTEEVGVFPGTFDYVAPTTVDEVVDLLARHGDDAKVLAGGQSLIPLMKLRFAAPAHVVDVNRVAGLDHVQEDAADGVLRIGALVRHRTVERSELVRTRCPTMAAAAPLISDPLVRNLGTVVGSLCHADPQGDWASVMLAMEAELVVRSASGERRIPMGELIEGPFTTTLGVDELATEVRVPLRPGRPYGTYLKLERKVGDFASVGVAVSLSGDGDEVQHAGIGLTAVGPTNIKAAAAERVLEGKRLDDATIGEAARLAADAAKPNTDLRGSADYKREVVRIYVTRALRGAAGALAA
jgi:aerobic carbon-monoxide dehydrogenase medium subunit